MNYRGDTSAHTSGSALQLLFPLSCNRPTSASTTISAMTTSATVMSHCRWAFRSATKSEV